MKISIIILLLSFFSQLLAQNEKDIIAKVGDKILTVDEFKYRFEFTPQINRKNSDNESAKDELLYTLIAENLFAIEAQRRGLDTLSVLKNNYIPLEKMFLRDALYQREIADKVELNIKKFNEGLKLASYKCFVDYVFAVEQQNIDSAYTLLKSNSNFDSLVTQLTNAEYVSEPYEVVYGKMYEHAEDAIYSLGINEFTKPIESPDGWYIFRLISKIPATFTSNDQKNSMVEKVVEGRVEDSIYNDFRTKFFADKRVTTNGSLFWYLAEGVQKLVLSIKTVENIEDGEKIPISNEQLSQFIQSLEKDSLDQDYIFFDKDPVSLRDFLRDFSFEGFYTYSTDLNTIAAQLKSRSKRQIELELLTREAYKKGIASIPEVNISTELWKENYLATLLKRDIVLNTELTETDIKEYFKTQESDTLSQSQYNIIEVLTDDLEIIKQALSLSEDDEILKKFALEYTQRERTKLNGGEFGYFTVSEFEDIGKIVESMEIGDVYGPLQTEGGYSIFKLIDKKETKINAITTDVDENIKRIVKYDKIMNQLENLAVKLAEENNVTINREVLNSLELLNVQMMVYRYMGFGGRIQAYPYSSPFYKWEEKWEQKKKDLL
jgi:parvulin-like peptidyl-prolyl isomerase